MTLGSSQRPATSVVLDDELGASAVLTCPMCHTPMALAQGAIDAGADWPCVRCGQRWDATRLSAVAAYAAWVVERFAAGVEGGEPPFAAPGSPAGPRTR